MPLRVWTQKLLFFFRLLLLLHCAPASAAEPPDEPITDEGLLADAGGPGGPGEHLVENARHIQQDEEPPGGPPVQVDLQITNAPFDPSVPDFAAGSESSYEGHEEYMRVCMWTFRQLTEVCAPGEHNECEVGSIMAHTLQDQLRKFYRHGPYARLLSEQSAKDIAEYAKKMSHRDAGDSQATSGDPPPQHRRESRTNAAEEVAAPPPGGTPVDAPEPLPKSPRILDTELTTSALRPAWNAEKFRLTIPTAPPIESCGWIVLGTTRQDREQEEDSCPGLTISCLLLMAEVFLLNSPDHFSLLFATEAEDLLAKLRTDFPKGEYFATHIMWPVQPAFTSYGLEYAATVSLQEMRVKREEETLMRLAGGDHTDGLAARKDDQEDAGTGNGLSYENYASDGGNSLQLATAQSAASSPLKYLDVVIARCDSPMMWLWEFAFPQYTRFFIYEKCREKMHARGEDPDQILRDQIEGLEPHVKVFVRELPERDPRFMSGECTAYLAYILEMMAAGSATFAGADHVAFIHDDGPRHFKQAFFNIVLQSIEKKTYEVDFLHLSHERYAALVTPCFERVFQLVFGEPLLAPVTSYCCSNFVVSKKRIELRDKEFYANLADLIFHGRYTRLAGEIARNESSATSSSGGGGAGAGEEEAMTKMHPFEDEFAVCNVGHKPCYVMEFLWHVVFGEELELPYREEDPRLPLALRYGGGRDTLLPSALKLSPYNLAITPKRFTNKLRRLKHEHGIGG
eukprot:g1144.t1